jgi:stage II sporulation protein R
MEKQQGGTFVHIKEFKIIGLSLIIGMGLSLLIAARLYAYAENAQSAVIDNVIRFHVKANSDLPEDQALKTAIRDRVLYTFSDGLSAANNVGETRSFIMSHMDMIIKYAQEVVYEWGYDYPVTASIETVFFPTRVYGDMVFPPGNYEALRIIIGEGAGSNWWCLLFPPLCYVDITRSAGENEKRPFMHLLPDEGFTLVAHMNQNETIQVKFKLIEWWQARKEPVGNAVLVSAQ